MAKSFYTTYYQNTLQHSTGFKLVLGGTGLGKTSGIIEIVKQNTEGNKRFFYVASRLQLLNEMAADLDKLNKELEKEKKAIIGYCLQERDEEIIKKIKKDDFEALLSNKHIQKYTDKLYKGNANFVKQNYFLIQEFAKKENNNFSNNNDVTDFLNEKVRSIFAFFRKIIKSASEEKEQKAYNELIQNPTIKILFPYLDFVNNPTEKRIFLVSLQKAFYGFFDGKQVINLYKLKNNEKKQETNIIFLDEFDFLENDLLTQICKDTAIEQPFSFVEYFYTVLTKYKLSREHFLENHPKIRAELDKITTEVKTLKKNYGLPFPQINHFLCNEAQLKGTSIFQTRYSIGNFPIFLNHNRKNNKKRKIKAFYLEIANEQNKPNAYVLLNVVNQTTSAIIRLFKNLEFEHPKIYQDLIEHCFGTSDKFKRTLKQIHQHPHRRIAVGTNESKMYYNGFGLYEICDLGYATDREEVELRYYSLFTTPESILLHLAKNNLVFGLSATAEINRYVKNFDLYWLKNELSGLYYEISNEDTSLIQKANESKFEKRKNQAQVQIAETNISEKITNLIDDFVHTHQQDFEEGKKREYRKKRLIHFFATLQWVAENQEQNNTNLLFFGSYKQILKLFEDWKEPEKKAYKIQEINNSLKNCFQIHFEGKDFIVLFFDASQGKEIAQNEEEQNDYYELFWRGLPVLLVTTYPSAGNGVNLFFYKDQAKTQKADFSNIHLLDSPYYFFNPIDKEKDNEQTKNEKIKANIYYLAKLEKNKIISERQFKAYLNNIRNIDNFNNFYLSIPDGLSNRVSTYIQALGRIERVWEQMNTQVIRLDNEVYNQLEDFATKDDFYAVFKRNEPYFSQNVKALFAHILENKFGREYQQRQVQWEGLKATNNRCIAEIKKLLAQLNLVRENKLPQERAMQIRKEWQNLREYALKQSFAKIKEFKEVEDNKKEPIDTDEYKLFKKYACTFETDLYDHKNKCLWIQKDTLNIVPREINPDSSFEKWNLDSAFQNVQNNAILRGHFDLNQFEQGFSGKGIYFTPYFYQCILAGAIGEEVVKAVFEHEKIILTEKEIPNELFELIDLKIVGKNWYIDAKNYSEQTITHFQLAEDDYFFHPKLNETSFKEKAQEKLNKIIDFHKQEDCKIIYINAFGNGERPTNYYDENFNEVGNSFEKAKIIVIQSMLKAGKSVKNDKNYSPGFQYFISELKNQLNNG
jgi:hypothetical protein